jgi:tRNA(Arg) A34 adenosine deaminase TadA
MASMSTETSSARGVLLTHPGWLERAVSSKEILIPVLENRMRWVIDLARRNAARGSGGPFAAAVFAAGSGRLLAAGVNRVEPLRLSPAHAEIMAIAFAQARLRTWDLGRDAAMPAELVASSQPCLMCLGAVLWSGVTKLVYGALAQDVTSILGFDEGPLPKAWRKELQKRGIDIRGGVLREEAVDVLKLYKKKRGTVYNSRQRF